MKVVVYGTGCPTCNKLEQNVKTALFNLDIAADVDKCTDINQIADAGVLSTPGLSINGKMVSQGKLLAVSRVEELLKEFECIE